MRVDELTRLTTRPEVNRAILGGYRGAYSLGVTCHPSVADAGAFLVRVEGDADKDIPPFVAVEGEQIPVIARGGFQQPLPFVRVPATRDAS